MRIISYKFNLPDPYNIAHLQVLGKELPQVCTRLGVHEWLLVPAGKALYLFVVADQLPRFETIAALLLTQKMLEKSNRDLDPAAAMQQNAPGLFLRIASGFLSDEHGNNFLREMREAYGLAGEMGGLGPVLHHLFQRSIWLHERARLETDYFKLAVHEENVLCELAGKIFGSLSKVSVYIYGRHAALRYFLDELRDHGCRKLVLLHNGEKDFEVPDDGLPLFCKQLPEQNMQLGSCDVLLVFNTDLTAHLAPKQLAKQLGKRGNRPLLLFDYTESLPLQNGSRNLYLYTRQDLQVVIRHNRELMQASIEQIDAWIEEEVADFYQWLSSDTRYQFAGIIGSTQKMQRLFELISRISQTNITVLIDGESGTGKELVAKAIHQLSARRNNQFVTVNCGAIPENLLESELFGHVRGAFTGAVANKSGLFELADKGTIFLDEIAELAPHLQVKLLRFLQEGEIKPVGGNEIFTLDVRVLAATNKELAKMVDDGKFRSDLYYRLNVLQLTLPALRERKQDIPLLARSFINKYAQKFHKNVKEISPEALDLLMSYHWPGNIRELENAIERAVALAVGTTISRYDLPASIANPALPKPKGGFAVGGRMTLQELEKRYILHTLEECNWNYEFVCKALGIGRTTLWRKLKEYKLETE